MLVKYWLSVSDDEQERRFKKRLADPRKRWKFSPTDLEARARWVDYAEAKDRMFNYTDTERQPLVRGRGRRQALRAPEPHRHLLSLIPYEHVRRGQARRSSRRAQERNYLRPPKQTEQLVPERYSCAPTDGRSCHERPLY